MSPRQALLVVPPLGGGARHISRQRRRFLVVTPFRRRPAEHAPCSSIRGTRSLPPDTPLQVPLRGTCGRIRVTHCGGSDGFTPVAATQRVTSSTSASAQRCGDVRSSYPSVPHASAPSRRRD